MKQPAAIERTYGTRAILFVLTLVTSTVTISLSLQWTFAEIEIEDNDQPRDFTSYRKMALMAISNENVYAVWLTLEAVATSAPNTTSSMNSNKVSMMSSGDEGYSYLPATIQVKVGESVIWTNDDDTLHTVTSGSGTDENAGAYFDSGMMGKGKIYEHLFTAAGEYPYFCIVHPDMIGRVIVS